MFQHTVLITLYFFEHHVFVLLYFFAILYIPISKNGCSLQSTEVYSARFLYLYLYLCV